MFCGSDAGGQRAACFYTIIETAKLNGINPEAHLTEIISRIDHRSPGARNRQAAAMALARIAETPTLRGLTLTLHRPPALLS